MLWYHEGTCFHESMQRAESEAELRQHPPGSWLFRLSSVPGMVALSYSYVNDETQELMVEHVLCKPTDDNQSQLIVSSCDPISKKESTLTMSSMEEMQTLFGGRLALPVSTNASAGVNPSITAAAKFLCDNRQLFQSTQQLNYVDFRETDVGYTVRSRFSVWLDQYDNKMKPPSAEPSSDVSPKESVTMLSRELTCLLDERATEAYDKLAPLLDRQSALTAERETLLGRKPGRSALMSSGVLDEEAQNQQQAGLTRIHDELALLNPEIQNHMKDIASYQLPQYERLVLAASKQRSAIEYCQQHPNVVEFISENMEQLQSIAQAWTADMQSQAVEDRRLDAAEKTRLTKQMDQIETDITENMLKLIDSADEKGVDNVIAAYRQYFTDPGGDCRQSEREIAGFSALLIACVDKHHEVDTEQQFKSWFVSTKMLRKNNQQQDLISRQDILNNPWLLRKPPPGEVINPQRVSHSRKSVGERYHKFAHLLLKFDMRLLDPQYREMIKPQAQPTSDVQPSAILSTEMIKPQAQPTSDVQPSAILSTELMATVDSLKQQRAKCQRDHFDAMSSGDNSKQASLQAQLTQLDSKLNAIAQTVGEDNWDFVERMYVPSDVSGMVGQLYGDLPPLPAVESSSTSAKQASSSAGPPARKIAHAGSPQRPPPLPPSTAQPSSTISAANQDPSKIQHRGKKPF